MNRFGWAVGKVDSVAPGVDRRLFYPRREPEIEQIRSSLGLHKPYLLTVGSLAPRKNVAGLLDSWQLGGFAGRGFQLVVVGAGGSSFRRDSAPGRVPGVIWAGYLSDHKLAALYSGARAFIFPSLYEGFGLPVLEAMACGAPVLASNRTAIPEAAGEAALFFNPLDAEDMVQVLKAALREPGTLQVLREKGLERAANYSWERTRDQISAILLEALQA